MSKKVLNFWKARKEGGGAALFFEYKTDSNRSCFVSMMPQGGSRKEWSKDKRINVKLGLSDIGALLAVINGATNGCGTLKGDRWSGLYHESPNGGNSSIQFHIYEKTGGFIFGLSRQGQQGADVERLSVGLTIQEVQLLRVFLEDMARVLMVDDYQVGNESSGEPVSVATASSESDEDIPF